MPTAWLPVQQRTGMKQVAHADTNAASGAGTSAAGTAADSGGAGADTAELHHAVHALDGDEDEEEEEDEDFDANAEEVYFCFSFCSEMFVN
jgi:hypothetical protein